MSAGGPSAPRGEELLAHGRFLRALARGLVGDPDRAEDLLHETLATAIAHPAREAAAPRAWLARILRSLAIKRGQRESERPAREARAARERGERDEADPPALLAEIELARRLLEAVERLREPYRGTLYLRYWRGLGPQLIAAEERVPLKTVKTRLARGLELLRSELDRRPGGREAWVVLLLPLARGGPPESVGPRMERGAEPGWSLAVPGGIALGVAAVLGGAWFVLGEAREAPRSARAPANGPEEPTPAPGSTDPPARVAREATTPARAPAEPWHGARITGSVVDEEGRGLSGVEVRAVLLASELRGPPGRRFAELGEAPALEPEAEVVSTSAADGSFALELSRAGLARLTLELDGHAPRSRRLFVARGQALTLEPLVLARGAALDGMVLDPAGAPVAKAELLLAREDEGLVSAGHPGLGGPWLAPAGTSDAQGRFHLTRVAAGDWRLEARAAGFAPAQAEGQARRSRGDEAEGETEALVLTLEPSASLAGQVLGLAPEELARARVLARPVERRAGAPVFATLDERGAFALAGLAPGEELELVVVGPEGTGAELRSEPLRVLAGGGPVQLFTRPTEGGARPELARGARAPDDAEHLAGTLLILVRAADGTPLPGALVAQRSGSPRHPFEASEVRAADAQGRLAWSGLAAGQHAFRVVSGVFGPEDPDGVAWTACTLRAGAAAELELASGERGDVHGVVRAAGRALSGARLVLRPEARPAERAPGAALVLRADDQGRFAFRGLSVGSYTLEVSHPERAQSERRQILLGAGGAELWIELADARFTGRVLDAGGRPLAGARVHVQAGRGAAGFARAARAGEVRADEQGRFELVGVDPEEAVVLVAAAVGQATLQREVRWPCEPLELVLAPEAPLTLELAGPARPFLALLAEGPRGERLEFGLAGGRETALHGLGSGRWRLTLRAPRGGRAEEPLTTLEVELLEGEPRRATLQLP